MPDAKSTAKSPAKKKKAAPKKPLVAFSCHSPHHDQQRPWALSVSTNAYRVVVVATGKGGAQSRTPYQPVCPACVKASKGDAGTNRQNGTIEVEVSDL